MADSIIPTEAEALEYIGFDYAAVEGDIIRGSRKVGNPYRITNRV